MFMDHKSSVDLQISILLDHLLRLVDIQYICFAAT